MARSISPASGWPDPASAGLGLIFGFGLAVPLAVVTGRHLVEFLLPLVHHLLVAFDDRFTVLFLGIDHTTQDTVVRAKVNLLRMLVVGTHVVQPQPKGWLEVSTPVGTLLQPMAIGLGLALAWTGSLRRRLLRLAIVLAAGLSFMLIDIPMTLHAYIWTMFLQSYDPTHQSPLMAAHQFLHNGGRLGVGAGIGIVSIMIGERLGRSREGHQPGIC